MSVCNTCSRTSHDIWKSKETGQLNSVRIAQSYCLSSVLIYQADLVVILVTGWLAIMFNSLPAILVCMPSPPLLYSCFVLFVKNSECFVWLENVHICLANALLDR